MTKTMYFGASVDDVNLEGYSSYEHLAALLAFWDELKVKGTMFVVPRRNGQEIGQDRGYVELLTQAHKNGHEIAQHGLDHTRFQTGIPPKMVLDLPHEGPAREHLAHHRQEIEAELMPDKLQKTLAAGRQMLESPFNIKIKGFRAPCLSTCDNLFTALAKAKYFYDSSHVLQPVAWDMINQPEKMFTPKAITGESFRVLQRNPALRTLPIAAEYTWYLKRAHYTKFLELARHDFDACLAAGIPFVPVCHVSPVHQGDKDCGLELYRELISYARRQTEKAGAVLVFETLGNIAAKIF